MDRRCCGAVKIRADKLFGMAIRMQLFVFGIAQGLWMRASLRVK